MENKTYEEAINRLEIIVRQLEEGKVPLEESMNLYKEGLSLVELCDHKLKNIEGQMVSIYENGQFNEIDKEDL